MLEVTGLTSSSEIELVSNEEEVDQGSFVP